MPNDFAHTARLTEAARRENASAEDHLACARSLLDHRLPERALDHLLRASALLPSPELAALAGSVAVSVGRLECAVEQFQIQKQRDPDAPEPYANLALIDATRENWSGAADEMREAIRRQGSEPEWHNDLGVILFKLEDFKGAQEALERALSLRPSYADAALNLADLYEACRRTEEAFRALAEVLRYRPGDQVLETRKKRLYEELPLSFRETWQERPLHPSVYGAEYFEEHLGTSVTTALWRRHRGRKLDRRFETVVQLARVAADDEMLDLGCGRGELARYFSGICQHVVALDYSESAMSITREVCSDRPNVEMLCADAKSIDYQDRFALVVLTDVIEHLRPWEMTEVLEKSFRALKPGGQIILHSPIVGEIRLGQGEAAHTHVVPREIYDFPVHVNLMTWQELQRVVAESGFEPGEVRFDGKIVFEARKPQVAVSTSGEVRPARGLSGRKIALFAANATFLKEIKGLLESNNEVRLFTGGSRALMERELDWCDLAWFEWCDELLVAATSWPKRSKIVCRLHSFEAFTHHPEHVDWSKVDGLMFVNESVRRLLLGRIPSDLLTTVIPNGVDFDRFHFPATKRYGKKVAYAGYLNFKKNPGFLLACFEALWRDDPQTSFHMAGKYQGAHIQVFLEHMLPRLPFKVHFDGWMDDMPAWLADKDYIISSSYFESFHYAVAEGIACGLLPLVYNWPGSENCYPAEVRFDTLAGCVEVMRRHREAPSPLDRAASFRDALKARFALPAQLRDTQAFLLRVLSAEAPEARNAAPVSTHFAAKPYWEARLSGHFDLAGVGYLDLGETYNRYMYKLRSHRLKRRLTDLGIDPTGRKILDVGSGTGFFLEFWQGYQPARLDGLDLTDTSVTRLRERFPKHQVHQADLSSRTWKAPERFDIISAFDVLFHIVDDTGFEQAIQNLATSLTPGGHLILTVCYTAAPYAQQSEHYRARTEAEYLRCFDQAGLCLVTAEPMFVTMNAPLDPSRVGDPELRELYDEVWEVTRSLFQSDELSKSTLEKAARWAYLHEQIHLASGVASPSSKLVVVRKGQPDLAGSAA